MINKRKKMEINKKFEMNKLVIRNLENKNK